MEQQDFDREELPQHVLKFLRQKAEERAIRILEREALEELFRDLEPWQYFWALPINTNC